MYNQLTTMVNSIVAFVTSIINFPTTVIHWVGKLPERAAIAVTRWALQKRSVQNVVADAFCNGTPLCRLLDDAVSSNVDSAMDDIDVDNIQGLERFVENELENFEVDADTVKGLDIVVETAISELLEEKTKELVDEVLEEMSQRLRR